MIHSKQRDLVFRNLADCHSHPTADELYNRICTAGESTVSLSTVYRNLGQLTDAGLVVRIPVPGGADRFDPVSDGHFHMLCEKCGAIADIPSCAIPDICPAVEKSSGCYITGYTILFSGLCPKCRK